MNDALGASEVCGIVDEALCSHGWSATRGVADDRMTAIQFIESAVSPVAKAAAARAHSKLAKCMERSANLVPLRATTRLVCSSLAHLVAKARLMSQIYLRFVRRTVACYAIVMVQMRFRGAPVMITAKRNVAELPDQRTGDSAAKAMLNALLPR